MDNKGSTAAPSVAAPSNAKAKGKGKAAAPVGGSTSQKKQQQPKQQKQKQGCKEAGSGATNGPPQVHNKCAYPAAKSVYRCPDHLSKLRELLQRMNFLHQAAVLLAGSVQNPKHLAGHLKRERRDVSDRPDDNGPATSGQSRGKRRRLNGSPEGLIPTQVEIPTAQAVRADMPDEAVAPTNEEGGDAMPVDRSAEDSNVIVDEKVKPASTLKQRKRLAKKASGTINKTKRSKQVPSITILKDISKSTAGDRLVVGRVLPITGVKRPDAPLPNPRKVRKAIAEHMDLSAPRIRSLCTPSEKKQLEKDIEALNTLGVEEGVSFDRLLDLAQRVVVNGKKLTKVSGDGWILQDYPITQKQPTLGSHYVKDLRAIARKSVLRMQVFLSQISGGTQLMRANLQRPKYQENIVQKL